MCWFYKVIAQIAFDPASVKRANVEKRRRNVLKEKIIFWRKIKKIAENKKKNLVEKKNSGWSFTKGQPTQMILKRLAQPDDHL